MDEIIKHEPGTEQISRFQSLQTGQYWRALQPIPGEGIDEGTVLLIQSIRWVDDAAHTIILLSPEHARDFIQKQAAANGAIARAVAEIANAAPTPHGIERWFIVPKESA